MTKSDSWKRAESRWARFFGGRARRHPSQGIRHEDISDEWFTAEHKYRTFESYSSEFRKAVEQHDDNKARNPTKECFVLFTFHYGKGIPNRYFLMCEVPMVGKDGTALEFFGNVYRRLQEGA